MAFSGNFMCTSFKKELMFGAHDFANGADTFKMALYTSSATLNASTTAYTASNETSGTGYTATGQNLTNVDPTTSGTTAFTDFTDETWSSSSITARGALIYNSTMGGGTNTTDAVAVLDFGADKTATSGTFTIQFPAFTTSAAILRIGNA